MAAASGRHCGTRHVGGTGCNEEVTKKGQLSTCIHLCIVTDQTSVVATRMVVLVVVQPAPSFPSLSKTGGAGSSQGGGFSKVVHSMWDRVNRPCIYQMKPARNMEDDMPLSNIHSRLSIVIQPMSVGSQKIWSIPLLMEGDTEMSREENLWSMVV